MNAAGAGASSTRGTPPRGLEPQGTDPDGMRPGRARETSPTPRARPRALSLLRCTFALVAAALSLGTLWPSNDAALSLQPSREALRAAILERARRERPQSAREPAALSPLERRSGIRVLGLQWTAGGYLIDFRFRVLDPIQAAPLLSRQLQPRLVAGDGSVLTVPRAPKLGALRQTSRAARSETNYFILFANPARHVRRGERVGITLGELRLEGLTVR